MYSKKGVTLIELVVVLALVAVVGAIAVPAAMGSLSGPRTRACENNRAAITAYFNYIAKTNLTVEDSTKITIDGTAYSLSDILGAGSAGGYTICGTTLEGCPDGGQYSVAADGTITCQKHAAADFSWVIANPDGTLSWVKDYVAANGNKWPYNNNSSSQIAYLEKNGGWYSFTDANGKTQYIKFYNGAQEGAAEDSLIYTNGSSNQKPDGSYAAGDWTISNLYNPHTKQWYACSNTSSSFLAGTTINPKTFDNVWEYLTKNGYIDPDSPVDTSTWQNNA